MCVSVVIPVLNEAAALPKLLESMRRLGAEILFVDGGSSDATVEMLEASGLRWISAPRGRGSQMNAGAAATAGTTLMFVHADTELPFEALGGVRRAVRNGAVGGSFGLRLDTRSPLLRLVAATITVRSRITGVATGDQALFVTRKAFDRLGGFSALPLFEDVDFSRRLKREGPVTRLPLAVVTSARRWRRGGALRTILRMWILKALYYGGVDPALLARRYQAVR